MKHFLREWCLAGLSGLMAVAATSCVDNDYDLSKDIDLTINVGGDLTVPSSSTDRYSMAQILDLDQNSSIKPDGQLYGYSEGDYVLVQSGNSTNSSVTIPRQQLSDVDCNSGMASVSFVGIGSAEVIDINVDEIVNAISVEEDDIDLSIVSISKAVSDIKVNFDITPSKIGNLSGTAFFKPGFTVTFPKGWDIAISDPAVASNFRVDGNVVTFIREVSVSLGSSFRLPIVINGIDLTEVPAGQGLYEPGKFRLNDRIVSRGPIGVIVGDLPLGQQATINFDIVPSVPEAEILEVTGSLNPKIDIAQSSFQITDVPDFLREPGNNLDITNPQVRLTVSNQSPVEINLNGRIIATDENGDQRSVWIGSDHGTAPILIAGNATTEICISRTGENVPSGAVNVVVPTLGNLISTIPDRIAIDDVDAKVPAGKEYTFILGSTYDVAVDYQAIVPLAFGSDLEFVYSTDETDWNEDLDKYSFHEALVTFSVENTVPLDMVPQVIALDRNGREMTDIVATVEGTVKAGTIQSPVSTDMKVRLSSTARNLGELDGVRLTFKATCPESMSGIPLNEEQALRFTAIKIKILGGVNVDLN